MQKVRCIKLLKNQLNALRFYTNAAPKNAIKYTDTINLPKTEFPQRLSAAKRAEVERKINEVNILLSLDEQMEQKKFFLFRIVSKTCTNGNGNISIGESLRYMMDHRMQTVIYTWDMQ